MNIPAYTICTKTIELVARIAEKLGEIRGLYQYGVFCHVTPTINRRRGQAAKTIRYY
ncbi:MAG: hypothetical protein FWH18_10820 [Marinilabiliaceae bacterium]|nr:hypothetical protein [Marinilabiliaceae bacterium]